MKHVHQSVWVHYIPMINNIVQNAQQRVLSMTIIVLQVLWSCNISVCKFMPMDSSAGQQPNQWGWIPSSSARADPHATSGCRVSEGSAGQFSKGGPLEAQQGTSTTLGCRAANLGAQEWWQVAPLAVLTAPSDAWGPAHSQIWLECAGAAGRPAGASPMIGVWDQTRQRVCHKKQCGSICLVQSLCSNINSSEDSLFSACAV